LFFDNNDVKNYLTNCIYKRKAGTGSISGSIRATRRADSLLEAEEGEAEALRVGA
jgi:hypothetical protein